ncbi:MAG: ATP-dependent Clp protease adaptor ClpS [Bacteroidales bacterium]
MVKEKTNPAGNELEEKSPFKELILHNDDHNTFDFVIDTLIEVCEHDPLQAEQCALVTHYKGKCTVKSGPFIELKLPSEEMIRRGLSVTIE